MRRGELSISMSGAMMFIALALAGVFFLKPRDTAFVLSGETYGLAFTVDRDVLSTWEINGALVCVPLSRAEVRAMRDEASDAGEEDAAAPDQSADQTLDQSSDLCDPRLYELRWPPTGAGELPPEPISLHLGFGTRVEVTMDQASDAMVIMAWPADEAPEGVLRVVQARTPGGEIVSSPRPDPDDTSAASRGNEHLRIVMYGAQRLASQAFTFSGSFTLGAQPGPGETGMFRSGHYQVHETSFWGNDLIFVSDGDLFEGDVLRVRRNRGREVVEASGKDACGASVGGTGDRVVDVPGIGHFSWGEAGNGDGFLNVQLITVPTGRACPSPRLVVTRLGDMNSTISASLLDRVIADPAIIIGTLILSILASIAEVRGGLLPDRRIRVWPLGLRRRGPKGGSKTKTEAPGDDD